jgi:hypothetical protein
LGCAGHFGQGGHGGQQAGSLKAPGLTVVSSLAFVEGHCLVVAAFVLGQQDLVVFVSLTAPGLAASSAFWALAADGHETLEQVAGEQVGVGWQDFDPSTAPGLTSACWVDEQPISSAAAHRTLAAIVFFMGSFPLWVGVMVVSAAILEPGSRWGEGFSGHSGRDVPGDPRGAVRPLNTGP